MTNPQNPGPYGAGGPPDPWSSGAPVPPGYVPPPGYQQGGYAAPGYQQGGYAAPGYQQGGYAAPGYQQGYPGGAMSAYQGGPITLPPAPPRPGSVTLAFWLWIIAAALAIVSAVLTFSSDVWQQAMLAAGLDQSAVGLSVRSLVNTVRTIAIIVGAIYVALYVFFAVKMLIGRNWSRIVLTVIGGLTILGQVTGSSSVTVNGQVFHPGAAEALGWVQAVCVVIAIVAMYLTMSNHYFTAMKMRKQYRG